MWGRRNDVNDGYPYLRWMLDETLPNDADEDLPVRVTGVSFPWNTQTSLMVNQSYQYEASISPSDATNRKVTWSSSNPAVASIDQNGLLTALSEGETTITVTTDDGNHTATSTMTVSGVALTGIKLDSYEITLGVGDGSRRIYVTPEPSDATVTNFSATSSDEGVATCYYRRRGYYFDVTGVGAGTAVITIRMEGQVEEFAVTVVDKVVSVENIEIVFPSVESINVGETLQLAANVYPDNASDKSVKWTTSDPDVAEIDEYGVLTAKKEGSVSIEANAGGIGTIWCCLTIEAAAATSVDDTMAEVFAVSPNPVKDKAYVQTQGRIERIELYDMAGRKVLDAQQQSPEIDLSSLPKGLYVFKLTCEGKVSFCKIVKE